MSQGALSSITNGAQLLQAGACQLTFFTIYNPNSSDVWLKFYDAVDAATTPTGGTAAIEYLIPAQSQRDERCDSGATINPNGLWAFIVGCTVRSVTAQPDSSNTAPTLPLTSFRFHTKP